MTDSEPLVYNTDDGHYDRVGGKLVWIPKSQGNKTPNTPIINSLLSKPRVPRERSLTDLMGGVVTE